MSQITDQVAAIIAILKADTDTATEVGTRVFGSELPRSETDNMARKAIVVMPSGGSPPTWAAGTVRLEVQRLDLICYGATLFEAEEVRRACFGALRAIERVVSAGVLVHWARPAGGSVTNRDGPDTDWPNHWNSWQVCSAEQAVA